MNDVPLVDVLDSADHVVEKTLGKALLEGMLVVEDEVPEIVTHHVHHNENRV